MTPKRPPLRLLYRVEVTQTVSVIVDPKKFTKKFMREFRGSMYQFLTLEDHARHLAQLHARGLVNNGSFIEGYGQAEDMGIGFAVTHQDEHIERSPELAPITGPKRVGGKGKGKR